MPPSTMKSWPVLKPDNEDSRYTASAPMSSGSPTRPTGCWAWSVAEYCGTCRRDGACQASVLIQPGLMLFTRTAGPALMASAWVKATSPPLAAA